MSAYEYDEAWDSGWDDTVEGVCDRCQRQAVVRFCVDPYAAEIYPEDPNEPEWWCYPCWESRADDI